MSSREGRFEAEKGVKEEMLGRLAERRGGGRKREERRGNERHFESSSKPRPDE